MGCILFNLLVEVIGLRRIRLIFAFKGEVLRDKKELDFCFKRLVVLLDYNPILGVNYIVFGNRIDICISILFYLKIDITTIIRECINLT